MKRKIILLMLPILLSSSLVFGRQNYETQTQYPIVPSVYQQTEKDQKIQGNKKINLKSIFEQPQVSLIINKSVTCNVWHTQCDVMGDQYWVKDQISNPQGLKSKEGHRADHCGAKDSWFVYLDKKGKPYAMLEMKAGSTNNLIPLPATFYTDNTYTQLRDPATIKVGERIYWTTQNKGQCWHHTGVTRLDVPSFEFVIDGESYFLTPGQSVEIPNVSAGEHTIIEKYDKDYIINDVSVPFTLDKNKNVVISVNINKGNQVVINFENKPINMPEIPEQETQIQTETQTQTQIVETEPITETQLQTKTEIETQLIIETELTTETETEQPITETQLQTQAPVINETEPKVNETEPSKQTQKQTQKKPQIISQPLQTEQPQSQETIPPTNIKRNSGVLGQDRNKETQKIQTIKLNSTNKKSKTKYSSDRSIEPVIESTTGKVTTIPKTGDETPMELLFEIYIGSILVIMSIVIFIFLSKKN